MKIESTQLFLRGASEKYKFSLKQSWPVNNLKGQTCSEFKRSYEKPILGVSYTY